MCYPVHAASREACAAAVSGLTAAAALEVRLSLSWPAEQLQHGPCMGWLLPRAGAASAAPAPGHLVSGLLPSCVLQFTLSDSRAADSTGTPACPKGQSSKSLMQLSAWQVTSPVQPGETSLVTAAGGATGSFAVQIARLAGAHTIATCGSQRKAEVLRELGADRVINYREEVCLCSPVSSARKWSHAP